MLTLVPRPQNYAWGAVEVIPTFLGQAPTDAPVAEAWFGAHPSAPSGTDAGPDLGAYLAQDPGRRLGSDVVARFGPHLPYLLKLIAPMQPLSLQVHPNLEQARAGCTCKDSGRSEEHTSELQSRGHLVCRLLLVKKTILLTIKSHSNITDSQK